MAWMDFFAESWLPCLRKALKVGMASSIRMVIMAMTMSNSIKVKPLGITARRVREFDFLRFMRFPFLCEQPKNYGLSEKILQRMDAKGKWGARIRDQRSEIRDQISENREQRTENREQ